MTALSFVCTLCSLWLIHSTKKAARKQFWGGVFIFFSQIIKNADNIMEKVVPLPQILKTELWTVF